MPVFLYLIANQYYLTKILKSSGILSELDNIPVSDNVPAQRAAGEKVSGLEALRDNVYDLFRISLRDPICGPGYLAFTTQPGWLTVL